jgi:predicted DNA-binding transcriptional regulator AlpA
MMRAAMKMSPQSLQTESPEPVCVDPTSDGSAVPRLLTPPELARSLGVSVSWLAKARMDGTGPPYVKIGRAVRYPDADAKGWVRAQSRTSTSEECYQGILP